MNEYLRNSSHNSHYQIYTSNRVFIPETQNIGRAAKILPGSCMPGGLVKLASGKLFSACGQRVTQQESC